MKRKLVTTSLTVLALGLTAACGSGGDSGKAESSTGPIKVWLSNNPEEISWGKAMVKEWNDAHSDQLVTAPEIPAGKTSEEVIVARADHPRGGQSDSTLGVATYKVGERY